MQDQETPSSLWLEPDISTLNFPLSREFSHSDLTVGTPAKLFPRHSMLSKGLRKAASSFAAFFLIAGVFTAFCKKLRSRVAEAGSPRRRLAEGGGEDGEDDDELQAILEDCLDLEEETKLLASSDVPPPHTGPSSSAATWDGAALTGALWPTSSSHWPFTLPLPTQESSPSGSSQPLLFPSDEGIRHQLRPAEGDTLEETPFQKDGWSPAQPQLEPGAWLEQIPDITSSEATAFLAGPETQASPGDDVQPSRSVVGTEELSLASAESPPPLEHPYVNVPKVQPGEITSTLKDYDMIPAWTPRGNPSHEVLNEVRGLLAKSELNAAAAERLLKALETLLAFVKQRVRPSTPARSFAEIVDKLGLYLLIFDSFVRAHEALGPALRAAEWWPRFASHFRIDFPEFPLDKACRRVWARQQFNQNLARRLQRAMRIYLTGIRPPKNEIIFLKRKLFSLGLTKFAGPRWDPWRHDDEAFLAEQASSGQSEDQDGDDEET